MQKADMAEKSDLEILKENYEPYRKRYALPTFEDLDREFDIRKADKNGFILTEILIQICAALTEYISFFDPALDPNPGTLHAFIEIDALDKKQKTELLHVYKQLAYLAHKVYVADLGSESERAAYIKEALKGWLRLKPKVRHFVERLTKEWVKGEPEAKVISEYFG